MNTLPTYGFEELCNLVDYPARTIRYYIQIGLVDRPDGINRGAKYTTRHVEQLLTIKKWQGAGISLERIRELLHGDTNDLPPQRKALGTIEVWSRLQVAAGIELHVEGGASGLSPEELRAFFRNVMRAYQELKNESSNSTQGDSDE
jgi:DNA-binding transcriptional MerR regulator